jgi:hypothetical protein
MKRGRPGPRPGRVVALACAKLGEKAIRRFTVRTVLPDSNLSRARGAGASTCAGRGARRTRDLFAARLSTPRCGSPAATTRCACSAKSRPERAGPSCPPTTEFVAKVAACTYADLHDVPRPPTAGTSRWAAEVGTEGHRLLLARVRHHRRAAAILRRPGHPRRGPPEDGQRPRRADHRESACSTSSGYFAAVAVPRRLAAGDATPSPTPTGSPVSLLREADGTPAKVAVGLPGGRFVAAFASGSRPGRPDARCCCSTPTSRRTALPSAR